MPFEIVRNDIANMLVDAIVDPASRSLRVNPGADYAIHKKAGPALMEHRKIIGSMEVGQVAVSPGFGLDAEWVIHAPSPIWIDGSRREREALGEIYTKCLHAALERRCESIAFPLMGAGAHGYPREIALRTAMDAISAFLLKEEMHVYLVVFGQESYRVSGKLFANVASFIDSHYVDEYISETRSLSNTRMESVRAKRSELLRQPPPPMAMACPMAMDREAEDDLPLFLQKKDAGFAVTLVSLIQKSGKKNPEVYKKANVDKKLFSKIINNVNYHPNKQTAVALALALELDFAQTQDLIGRAGYTLSRSSKFDLIIEYFILRKNYNVFEINEVLYDFDLPLLGC